jgi:hypothetical protein
MVWRNFRETPTANPDCEAGLVDKHHTTRITDNLLSAVRAWANSGIENVPSVCASETIQDGPPSAALGGQDPEGLIPDQDCE